jgi:phosphonatase-like hydrolase
MGISRRHALMIAAVGAVGLRGQAQAADGAAPNGVRALRLVALDVGGTIIQDHGEVPTAMHAALTKRDVAVTLPEIAEWRGASKRAMVRHFVDRTAIADAKRAALTDEIYADFSVLADAAYAHVQPIAGARDAIRDMRGQGLKIAATTGFDRALLDKILRRLGWHDLFDATVASDEVADGRPAPFMLFHAMEKTGVENVADMAAVGDTPLDLQAATNAGARGVIGVLTGAGTEERLAREAHTHILPSVADLPALLRRDFGAARI